MDTGDSVKVGRIVSYWSYKYSKIQVSIILQRTFALLTLQDVLQVDIPTSSWQRLSLVGRLVPADHVDDPKRGRYATVLVPVKRTIDGFVGEQHITADGTHSRPSTALLSPMACRSCINAKVSG